jgi:RHS repeat-associated protein
MAVKQSTNPQLPNPNYQLSYLHSDHLGSTVLVTKDDGTVESSLTYYPYGNSLDKNQESRIMNQGNDRLYTGQRLDASTSLYFYQARYYNPQTGHFVSADKAQGLNRYSYVGNNPVARNDPSGNSFEQGTGGGVMPSLTQLSPVINIGLPAINASPVLNDVITLRMMPLINEYYAPAGQYISYNPLLELPAPDPCASGCIGAPDPNKIYISREDAIKNLEMIAEMNNLWEHEMASALTFVVAGAVSGKIVTVMAAAQTIGECVSGNTAACAI